MDLLRNNKKGELEINWVCLREKCNCNCCGTFDDRFKTLVSLERIDHDEIMILPDEEKIFLKNGCEKKLKRNERGVFLKLKKDRSCPFLNNHLCLKYKVRPAICKAYPFFIDFMSGINVDKSCPGVGMGWTKVKDLKVMMQSLLKVYKDHIKYIEKKYVRK